MSESNKDENIKKDENSSKDDNKSAKAEHAGEQKKELSISLAKLNPPNSKASFISFSNLRL